MSHANEVHRANGGCNDCKERATEGRRCAACAERHRMRNKLAYARAKERGKRFTRG